MLDLVYLDIFLLDLYSFPFNRISAHFAFPNEPVSPSHNTAHFPVFQQHQYFSQHTAHSTDTSSMQGMHLPPSTERFIRRQWLGCLQTEQIFNTYSMGW
jgi:hypothetical protein